MTYTVGDVCRRYTVSEGVVLGWIRSGQLAAVNVARQASAKRPTWRITEAALAAFEASRTATPPTPMSRRTRRASGVTEFY